MYFGKWAIYAAYIHIMYTGFLKDERLAKSGHIAVENAPDKRPAPAGKSPWLCATPGALTSLSGDGPGGNTLTETSARASDYPRFVRTYDSMHLVGMHLHAFTSMQCMRA